MLYTKDFCLLVIKGFSGHPCMKESYGNNSIVETKQHTSGQGPPASGPDLSSVGFTVVPCLRSWAGRGPPVEVFSSGIQPLLCLVCAIDATSSFLHAVYCFGLLRSSPMTIDIKAPLFTSHSAPPSPVGFGCL